MTRLNASLAVPEFGCAVLGERGAPGALPICTDISVKNFRHMVLVFFWHRKQKRD